MSLASGLAGQIGWALETTVNTPATVTQFAPLVSETLTQKRERLESKAIIAGRRLMTSGQWSVGDYTIEGDIALELYNRGLGKLFAVMFGTVVTTGAGPYLHTFTPGDLAGDALTVQVGRPSTDGTVNPFTYVGMKVAKWEIACDQGKIATLGASLVGMREIRYRSVADGVTTNASAAITSATAVFVADDVGKPISGTGIPAATTILSVQSATAATLSANATASGTGVTFTIGIALASASYPASQIPLTYVQGGITVGGSSVNCRSVKLSGHNGLDEKRRFIGSPTILEPLEAELRTYDGSMVLEFTDKTAYTRFVNASEHAVVLTFTSGTDLVVATMNCRFDGETPVVKDTGILTMNAPFKCVASGADSTGITVALTNGDSTP